MITFEGKNHIKRYLAGWVPSIATTLVYGSGTRPENAFDKTLDLEIGRVPVSFVTYDFDNERLIFKASIPDDLAGKVYEVGLFSNDSESVEKPSRFITTFDSATETWVNPANQEDATFSSTSSRVGVDGLSQSPAAGGTITATLTDTNLDLSPFSGSDSFIFAYSVSNGNANGVTFKLLTDASNYYSFSMGTQTSGYKIVQINKGNAVVTGSPDWAAINEVQVSTTAKSGGGTTVEFDAIRLEGGSLSDLDYVLVSRKVLETPHVKLAGQPMDIECSIDITL